LGLGKNRDEGLVDDGAATGGLSELKDAGGESAFGGIVERGDTACGENCLRVGDDGDSGVEEEDCRSLDKVSP
jgi:hypothetical protein